MRAAESTCWTIIRGAVEGIASNRDEFVRRYESVVQAYLAARWRGNALRQEVDDTVQEVFLECFKQGGDANICSEKNDSLDAGC